MQQDRVAKFSVHQEWVLAVEVHQAVGYLPA